jgi:hypothetical protein
MAGNNGAMNKREKYVLTSGALAAFSFSASTGKLGDDMYFAEPIEIIGLFVQVVSAIYATATLVDLVITLEKSGSAVALNQPEGASAAYATITIPAVVTPGKAAGKVYRRFLDPITVKPGELMQLYVTTAAAASPQGTYLAGILFDYHPEIGANCANIVDVLV